MQYTQPVGDISHSLSHESNSEYDPTEFPSEVAVEEKNQPIDETESLVEEKEVSEASDQASPPRRSSKHPQEKEVSEASDQATPPRRSSRHPQRRVDQAPDFEDEENVEMADEENRQSEESDVEIELPQQKSAETLQNELLLFGGIDNKQSLQKASTKQVALKDWVPPIRQKQEIQPEPATKVVESVV